MFGGCRTVFLIVHNQIWFATLPVVSFAHSGTHFIRTSGQNEQCDATSFRHQFWLIGSEFATSLGKIGGRSGIAPGLAKTLRQSAQPLKLTCFDDDKCEEPCMRPWIGHRTDSDLHCWRAQTVGSSNKVQYHADAFQIGVRARVAAGSFWVLLSNELLVDDEL